MLKCIFALVLVLADGTASQIRCDTLFKGRNPVKIGHGSQAGSVIKWTDCAGNKPETFDNPPYSLDEADNCTVRPWTFGLRCKGDACKVVHQEAARKYFPRVRNGESVTMHVESDSVELKSQGEVIHMER